jgi:septal ring factor EnvC (AmiA/AmiB activator)
MRFQALLSAVLLFAAALSLPARAGMFDDEEARARIEALRAEHAELVKRVDGINRNQVDFANQIEAVKADIAKLRGQIEVLVHEMESTQKRQKDFYVDLDNRVRKLETAPPPEAKAGDAQARPGPGNPRL